MISKIIQIVHANHFKVSNGLSKKHELNGNFHICTDYYSISNDQTGQLIQASKFIKIDFRFSTDLEDSTDSGWIRDGLKM